jgi:hypothetical protein
MISHGLQYFNFALLIFIIFISFFINFVGLLLIYFPKKIKILIFKIKILIKYSYRGVEIKQIISYYRKIVR